MFTRKSWVIDPDLEPAGRGPWWVTVDPVSSRTGKGGLESTSENGPEIAGTKGRRLKGGGAASPDLPLKWHRP